MDSQHSHKSTIKKTHRNGERNQKQQRQHT